MRAISSADGLLSGTPELFDGLDAKGLAWCGLALIEGPQNLSKARACFVSARLINKDTGNVMRRLRLFDELAEVDTGSILTEIRAFVEGKE